MKNIISCLNIFNEKYISNMVIERTVCFIHDLMNKYSILKSSSNRNFLYFYMAGFGSKRLCCIFFYPFSDNWYILYNSSILFLVNNAFLFPFIVLKPPVPIWMSDTGDNSASKEEIPNIRWDIKEKKMGIKHIAIVVCLQINKLQTINQI